MNIQQPSRRVLVLPQGLGLSVVSRTTAAAGGGWWNDNGNIAGCVGAWAAKGAASQAASYTDLSGNENDLTEGNAPGWDSTNGWDFVRANSDYLKTGIVHGSTYSLIVRFSGATSEENEMLIGSQTPRLYIYRRTTGMQVSYGDATGGGSITGPVMTSGVYASTGTGTSAKGYRNGSYEQETSGTYSGTPPELYIGANNASGTPGTFFNGYIQAVAVYSVTLSSANVSTISTAMAAL